MAEKVTEILTFTALSFGVFKVAAPSKPVVAGLLEQDLQTNIPLEQNNKQGLRHTLMKRLQRGFSQHPKTVSAQLNNEIIRQLLI